MIAAGRFSRILTIAFVLAASDALAAEEGAWTVSKSSGEVWTTTTGAQQVSLSPQEVLKPGDSIRTGRNGRVLLVRGEETILVSPNSVIGLPAEKKEGLSTTIIQQAGSILLEVEKRNVKHFEVETPYLAAVVKGTQFRVSVYAASTRVDVIRGQVEVADFRSGQIAQVMPGQHATASANGNPGLSLSGSGTFSPIEQGRPRASSIERVPVPKSGLTAPRHAANGPLIRALGHSNAAARAGSASLQQRNAAGVPARHGVTRISSSLGEIRLNVHRVTHGLARGPVSTHGAVRNVASQDTVWSSRGSSSAGGFANGSGQGNSNDAGSSNAFAATGAARAIAAVTASGSGNGNGNGNGNGANGNGNGNGANGNGNGNNGRGYAYGRN